MSITITLNQARQLVAFFNSEDAEVIVSQGLDNQPAGLYAWLADHPEEGSMYLGSTEVSEEAGGAIATSAITKVPWDVAQAICDTPTVDSAIRTLLDDNTGDNATCMVRAVIDAYIPGEMTAVADVVAERRRQVDGEGWHAEHDDKLNSQGELALAACCYAYHAGSYFHWDKNSYQKKGPFDPDNDYSLWPWDIEWWKPKDPRRDLVRAGALILAEIERGDREKRKAAGSQA